MRIKNQQSFLDKEQGKKGIEKGMKKWKKLIMIGIVIIIGIGACGCNMKRKDSNIGKENEEKKKIAELVLNERQKEILKELRWSTNVKELDYFEKKAIIEIEEMLTAMEEKYNRSFSFIDYNGEGLGMGGLWEDECLIAYPSDGAKSFDSFEVRKVEGENGIEYEDDYMNVAIRDDFSEYMTKIASEALHTESVKVFAEVTRTTLTEVPSDEKMYNGAVGSSNYICIDSSSINAEELQTYVDELKKTFFENKLYGISQIIFLKANVIEKLNQYNYSYYDISDSYIEWEEISVQSYMEENNDIR